jgi:DNA-binding CsgD family transcriptional regulator
VGRADELAVLRAAVEAARSGDGSTHVLVGEAGVGKSRLTAELTAFAAGAGLLVLRGRAVDNPHPTVFRPLTEALYALMRDGDLPGADELDGFGPSLRQLLPGRADQVEAPLIAVAEGTLRLLRVLGRGRGCLLVLEDLHWADPETLALLEYLADHCAGERLACVATVRDEQPCQALELAAALDARGVARRVLVRRLPDSVVHEMIQACLGSGAVPPEVNSFVAARADGVPFFVEELLAGLVDTGALIPQNGGWRAVNRLVPVVPLTVRASIRQRFDADPATHDVLAAAAVLGRRFDWALLPGITGKPEPEVLAALRAGIAGQLVDTDDDQFRFRHALTRDAVLGTLLPPERARLARAAVGELQAENPELDGDRCELAASLFEACDDKPAAARMLVTAADRALRRGALGSAEALLTRAGQLGADVGVRLLQVLALGGQSARVFELGGTLSRRSPTQRTEIKLALARAAIAAGRWALAGEYLRDLDERATVLAAQVAMGEGREADAVGLAEAALAQAERLDLPETACEALEILGRVVRAGDIAAAEACFERALAIAEREGLAHWRLRALHELGTIDLLDNGRVDRLAAAREAAVSTGALATLAVIDLHIGDLLTVKGTHDEEAIAAATRSVELSRRLGLATLPAALGHLAACEATMGRGDVAEALLLEMRQLGPGHPDALVAVPLVRALQALAQADDLIAREQFDLVADVVATHPTAPFPQRGIWALLCTMQGAHGEEARETVRNSGALGIRVVRAILGCADAVAAGQSGDARAVEVFAEADRELAEFHQPYLLRNLVRRLVAEAALKDGWGTPVEWLNEILAWFEDNGRDRLAARCRMLLKQAGVAVPRRAGRSTTPAGLRELGVTAREMEVLDLVAEGLSNAEIGQRLYISPRTVEKHVEKLLARTGTRTRGQLAVHAERLKMG